MALSKPKGMVAFTIIWAGQLVSVLGTSMTQFALMIWVWDRTHEATATVLMGAFSFAPLLVLTPIAGAFVDRWNRKKTMILSDLIAGIGTIAIFVLFSMNILEVWHLYIIGIFVGAFGAFQYPAYSAAISMLVEKKHYVRADSMLSIVDASSTIFAPPLAAVFMVIVGIQGILVFDILTFCLAIGVVLPLNIPQPESKMEKKGIKGLYEDSLFGFKYVNTIRPLLMILIMYAMMNFMDTISGRAMQIMVLARTGDSQSMLALVFSAIGIGAMVGGIITVVWGGPKRRMRFLVISSMFSFILGIVVLFDSPYIWALGVFAVALTYPLANGCSQGFWQAKVAPDIQGRVFAARRFIAMSLSLVGILLSGPLADQVFGPAMMPGGALASSLSWLIQPGVGAGLTLMVLIFAIGSTLIAIIGYSFHSIREADVVVPDHDIKNVDVEVKTT